ncbi:C4-dicarboxylate ABC transporter permease [Vibrio nigripulchritudo]|uniref:TRAP transporter large permease n=2 Tax=Vibrio nigripulchritudo TaxID=28173 RepID=UPI00190D26A1|nr:TRAP transporter large permease subunit [Vibrio nigripulchritudo]BCL73681.1 C4-dicarboxylate ABC transporter permease [Vibrio nigripulchritudo]BDU34664.1 C4-dicarboxylate ABC transporter permease [Vibrio nigripulchritudo]
MEWWQIFIVILGSLITLMMLGLPVAFSFLVVNIVGAYIFMGQTAGIEQLVFRTADALTSFTLLPIALFMIMGEVMFHSKIGIDLMDTLDKWFGKIQGRLAYMAVGGGVLFSTLTGNSMGSIALLGSSLVPEMEKRGYKKPMSLGPILGSGGLAIMIPPSSLAVVLGVVAELSIGKILIAIILPGFLMAALYAIYIMGRCRLQPEVAPSFEVHDVPTRLKVEAGIKNVLPLGIIIFAVVGVIFLGIATPTEAAATGAASTFLLAFLKRRLNWQVFKGSLIGSTNISVMILLIVSGAVAFTQLMAFTGATSGLVDYVSSVETSNKVIVLLMLLTVIILGMFMGPLPIMLITLPVFIPLVQEFGYDTIWFAVMYLIAIETGSTSPPLGSALFVMKAVAPKGTSMKDIYWAAVPFLVCDFIAMGLVFAFPEIVQWPVSMMFK